MSLTIPHSQTHRESSLVLGIPDIHPTPVMIIEDIDRPLLDHHHPLRSTSLARPSSPAEPALCSFHKVGAGLHIMAWSEDDVVKSGSITIVDITAKGEVAPPVLVEINDEEAQLERIKKVIEVVNKSEYLHGAFEEAMLELLETYLKLLNSPQHRWSSTALVLERILIAWELFLQAYRKLNRPVPLIDMDRTLCIKFYSMIESIRAVQIKAQVMQTFIIVDVGDVTTPIVFKKQQMARSALVRRLERPAKRVKTLELLSTALDIVADDDKKDVNRSGERFKTAA
ncbi:unnamed protein product [Sphagnum tenellum]